MEISDVALGTTDRFAVERSEHRGESGMTYWRTRNVPRSCRLPEGGRNAPARAATKNRDGEVAW